MKCLIICSSGDIYPEIFKSINISEYFIICADGGLKAAESAGIIPDLWVGDADSLGCREIKCKEKKVFPSDKDFTDSHIAACEAIKRGFGELFFIGATGGRLDHEYANFCLLKYVLKKGAFGIILNKNNRIFLTDKSIEIKPLGMKYISFFPFGGSVKDFSVKGAKYELKNHFLTDCDTLTVSNEFISERPVKITFKEGFVLVICSNDCKGD